MSIAQAALAKAPRFPVRSLSLQRIFPRCENPRCAHEGNLWPVVRRRSAGIHLEGRWFCGQACFEQSVAGLLDTTIVPLASRWKPKAHRLPIGLVLLSRGVIRDDQLREALDLQRLAGTHHRLGHWLQQMGAATEDEITSALAAQWACPVFPLAQERSFLHCSTMFPAPLIKAARMLPVYVSRDRSQVYVAFVDGIDHSWLRSAEHILGCETVPCLVSPSAFNRAVEEMGSRGRSEEFVFENLADTREIARITTSFALQLRAKSVQLVGCREFAWARIHSSKAARDILFRLPVSS
jgi:MshEN domain